MSEINLEELSKSTTTRPQLEEVAVSIGLVDAKAYANKPAVLEAIKRVHEGNEDAATVNTELKPEETTDDTQNASATDVPPVQTSDDDADDDDVEDDDESASDKPKKAKKTRLVKNRNQGHPTAFDETGRPMYKA